MSKLFIEDLGLRGQRVLMRVDFDVPIRDGRVDRAFRASLSKLGDGQRAKADR
jgi:3-phosphoglycerate kinase